MSLLMIGALLDFRRDNFTLIIVVATWRFSVVGIVVIRLLMFGVLRDRIGGRLLRLSLGRLMVWVLAVLRRFMRW